MGILVYDTEADARRFLKRSGISFPTGLDADLKLTTTFGVPGTPMTVLGTKDGWIAERIIGPIREEQLSAKIQTLR